MTNTMHQNSEGAEIDVTTTIPHTSSVFSRISAVLGLATALFVEGAANDVYAQREISSRGSNAQPTVAALRGSPNGSMYFTFEGQSYLGIPITKEQAAQLSALKSLKVDPKDPSSKGVIMLQNGKVLIQNGNVYYVAIPVDQKGAAILPAVSQARGMNGAPTSAVAMANDPNQASLSTDAPAVFNAADSMKTHLCDCLIAAQPTLSAMLKSDDKQLQEDAKTIFDAFVRALDTKDNDLVYLLDHMFTDARESPRNRGELQSVFNPRKVSFVATAIRELPINALRPANSRPIQTYPKR